VVTSASERQVGGFTSACRCKECRKLIALGIGCSLENRPFAVTQNRELSAIVHHAKGTPPDWMKYRVSGSAPRIASERI
jgi:hypothetical protein